VSAGEMERCNVPCSSCVSLCRSPDCPAWFLGVEVMAEADRWETSGGPEHGLEVVWRP